MPYYKTRPMPHEKVERNKAIVTLYKSRELTYADIGVMFGITKQAVGRIVRRVNEAVL